MRSAGKAMMKFAGAALVVLLAVSMVLGYAGDSGLATVGNTLLLFALLVTVPALVVGLVLFLAGRASGNHPPRPTADRPDVVASVPSTPADREATGATPNGASLAQKLADLDALLSAGSISHAEYEALRARAMDAFGRTLDK